MKIQKRLGITAGLIVIAAVLYGAAKFYSDSLVLHVVEQTLIQKAPPGTDLGLLHKRLHDLVSDAPNQKAKIEKLFRISQYLEKIQSLTSKELDELLTETSDISQHGMSSKTRAFCQKMELFAALGCPIIVEMFRGIRWKLNGA